MRNTPEEFFVEWADGEVPEDVALKRRANKNTRGQYIVDVGGGKFVATLGGVGPD